MNLSFYEFIGGGDCWGESIVREFEINTYTYIFQMILFIVQQKLI